MTEINFYHLMTQPLEAALPKLLERTLESGARALVLASDAARVTTLNDQLWTWRPDSWLPHGAESDGEAADQPIWLTTTDENPNEARFLFLIDGAESAHIDQFDRAFELFDGRDEEAVRAARTRWKRYREAGHTLSYWRQDNRGVWTKEG